MTQHEKAAVQTFASATEFAAQHPQIAASVLAQDVEVVPPEAAGVSLQAVAERAKARQDARADAAVAPAKPAKGFGL